MGPNKLTGVKEIARIAKVSRATVDRVIYNRGGVSKKTEDKIKQVIEELDYKPNILAKRLASPKKLKLAILLPKSSETTYWESLYGGVLQAEKELNQYGVEIGKYFFDQNNKKTFIDQSEIILQSEVDGVLLTPLFIKESIRLTDMLEQSNVPFVFINSDLPNRQSLSYIGPDLYHSGRVVAHLLNYLLKGGSKILIVNIAKELEINESMLRIEEGFRNYVSTNQINFNILGVEIKQIDHPSIEQSISEVTNKNDVKKFNAIFVTNSRVSSIAKYVGQKTGWENTILIGFDFLDENIEQLQKETIDFLICHKHQDQAYIGINTLFQYLVADVKAEKVQHMPIDIITKENARFYKD